jgi:hypothetical protein
LQIPEGQDAIVALRDDFAVENARRRQRPQCGGDFRERRRDVVERARVQGNALRGDMRLNPHAVVFVLDQPSAGGKFLICRAVRDRRREHKRQRRMIRKRDARQRVVLRRQRDGAYIAGGACRAANGADVAFECRRNGVHDEAFAQADAQFAGHDLDDVRRFQDVGACAQDAFAQNRSLAPG